MYGYGGKVLRVNLTGCRVSEEKLSEDTAQKFLGGRGLGAKILFEELKPGIDPLGEENKFIFAVGPMVGAAFPGNARYCVMAKSPLTDGWGEASAAGFFGPELKYAGYDAVIFEGRSSRPIYLWIHDGYAEIRDARHLWGKVTGDVERIIRKEHGDDKIKVASIGPGGENLVRYACVISDLNRAAGRCGMGAVMGSKKLKAVAVRGTQKIKVADYDKFMKLARSAADELRNNFTKNLHDYGTAGDLDDLHGSGRLPTQAFRKCMFEGFDKITGETMAKTILKKRFSCLACPIACIRMVGAKEPYEVDPAYGGPEYETCASLGSFCMNEDLVAIAKANELCNKYSIDTISVGVAIAFSMECYERGLITKRDTGGLELTWGNPEAVVQLVERIAKREGIGDILAEGVMRAAQKIGGDSEKFALHIKGMELPMHEPRGKKGVGLSYATSNRGACHLQSAHDDRFEKETSLAPEIGLDSTVAPLYRTYAGREKAHVVKIAQDLWSLYDSLIICKFPFYPPGGISTKTLFGIFKAITGWDFAPMDLMTIGERAFNLCRTFNVREGRTRKDDILPDRLMEQLPEGLLKGEAFDKMTLDKMLDNYYELRGWDVKTGIPTRRKLEELGLGYVADELALSR